MAVTDKWYNADGLEVNYGRERAAGDRQKVGRVITAGEYQEMVVPFAYNKFPSYDVDRNNDGTLDAFSSSNEYVPAGALIESAKIIVKAAFTTSDSGALQIGCYEQDGTVIDADGIDVAIAVTAIDAIGEVVNCDGAMVGLGTQNAAKRSYIRMYASTGAFTAGSGLLVIRYVLRGPTT